MLESTTITFTFLLMILIQIFHIFEEVGCRIYVIMGSLKKISLRRIRDCHAQFCLLCTHLAGFTHWLYFGDIRCSHSHRKWNCALGWLF